MNNIIVIGVTHHNTLSMVRCLGMSGFGVTLFIYGDKNSYIRYSKYVTNYISTNCCDEVFDILKAQKDESKKPVVISCTDEVSHCFDVYYDELKDYYHFFNAGAKGRMTHYMDKQVQVTLAGACGLDIPRSSVKEKGISTVVFDSFPCICKPLSSISGQKTQICICNNQQELNRGLKGFDLQARVQIQEFIKKEYEIVVVGLQVNGNTIIPGFIRKIRDRIGGTTYATVCPIDELPENVITSVKKFVDEVHYEGLFGMELIYASGKYYFVEINLRNDATTFAFCIAGVNLVSVYVKAKFGEDYHDETSKELRKINSMVELADISHVKKGEVSIFKWLKEYRKCECLYYSVKDDLMPCRIAKYKFILEFIGHLISKLKL